MIYWTFATSDVLHRSYACAHSRARRGGWRVYAVKRGDRHQPTRPCRNCGSRKRASLPNTLYAAELLCNELAKRLADELAAGDYVVPGLVEDYRRARRRLQVLLSG